MNGRQERERQKAQLLRQIQQQRLELSACRRHWHEATGAPRPRLAYAAEFTFVADGWQRSDGRMVRTTSAFFNALDQTRTRTVEHLAPGARDPAPVGSSLAALSVGAFLAPTLCHFPVPYCTLFAATCAFSVARPSLRRPLPHAIPGPVVAHRVRYAFASAY